MCVCVSKPCGVYLEKDMKVKNITQVNNPLEKPCAAEKNRTTDTMWVDNNLKKGGEGGGKRGKYSEKWESTQNRKEPYDVLKRT